MNGFLSTLITPAQRFIKYGSRVGRTTKDGVKVYRRGLKTTAIDNNGNVVKTISRVKMDNNKTQTNIITPIKDNYYARTQVTTTRDLETGEVDSQILRWNLLKLKNLNLPVDMHCYSLKGSPKDGYYLDFKF